jgi:hypothetical protein
MSDEALLKTGIADFRQDNCSLSIENYLALVVTNLM